MHLHVVELLSRVVARWQNWRFAYKKSWEEDSQWGRKLSVMIFLQVIGSCVLFRKGKDKLKLVPNVVSFNSHLVKIKVVVRFLDMGNPNLDSISDYLCSIKRFWSFIVRIFLILLRVSGRCQAFGWNYAVRFARITPLLQPIKIQSIWDLKLKIFNVHLSKAYFLEHSTPFRIKNQLQPFIRMKTQFSTKDNRSTKFTQSHKHANLIPLGFKNWRTIMITFTRLTPIGR